MDRKRLVGLAAILWLLASGSGPGSETDNLTFRYVPLEESAPKLNRVLNELLDSVLGKTNEKLSAGGKDPRRAADTEVEWTFARSYSETFLRKVGDRLLPVPDTCVEKNDCPGWPALERIPLKGRESVYGEAQYNKVAIAFLSPTFRLCGVRMGADKLTHLFSHGFYYYNAARAGKARFDGEQDVRRTALADERGLMGVHSTAVVSPADAEATTAGYRLATDYFQGPDPLFARSDRTGLLRKRRPLDVCAYVSPAFDEVVNPPTFTAGRRKVSRLEAAIAERWAANVRAEASMTAEQIAALKDELVRRPLDAGHARLPFFYKIYLAFKYIAAYLTVPRESRLGAKFLVFPDFQLEHRRPIELLHETER